MIPVLNAAQNRAADAYTITHEPISSVDLMERAAKVCFQAINSTGASGPLYVFCGPGNNGGDGLVLARLWHEKGVKVQVFLVKIKDQCTPDFEVNRARLESIGLSLKELRSVEDIPEIPSHACIVDAIFGTGLSRPINGLAAEVVKYLNRTDAPIVAIDAPSGLFMEDNEGNVAEHIIKAWQTFTFQFPKLAFFLAENHAYVGAWQVLDIGLSPEFLEDVDTACFSVEKSDVTACLNPRSRHSHKGDYGHALIVAGSLGMIGAALLATRSALRSGVGLLTAMVPQVGYHILQSSAPEAMCLISDHEEVISGTIPTERYQAIGVGPGLGQSPETALSLSQLLKESHIPLVLDADALNFLAEIPAWWDSLPVGSILTPHPGEFKRLFGATSSDYTRLQLLREKAKAHQCVILLKGAFTAIATPDGKLFFNTTGNPGMATGGSGDVLTGLITGLVAQGLSSEKATLAAVYLHGLAGDLAAEKVGQVALTASDIIDHLPAAQQILRP